MVFAMLMAFVLASPVHAVNDGGECDQYFIKVYVKVGSTYQFYRNYTEVDDVLEEIADNPTVWGYADVLGVCANGWERYHFSNGRVSGL